MFAAAFLLLGLGVACGGLPFGSEPLVDERPAESPLTWGLLMSWLALGIGSGSAVLGIWIDRDKARPAVFAVAMSVLILAAVGVGGLQGFLDEEGAIETRANLERMLDMVEDIAANSDDPNLAALVAKEGKNRRARGKAKGGKGKGKAVEAPAPTEPAPTEPAPTEPAPADGATGEAPAPEPAPAGGGAKAKGGKGKSKGGE